MWAALCGLTVAFLVIGWMVLPTGEPFWMMAKGATAGIAIMAPAIRYLRNHPRKEIES